MFSRTVRPGALLFLFVLSAVALAAVGCRNGSHVARLPDAGTAGPRAVRTAPVVVTMDTEEIRATGTAAPTSTTKVMPLVPGVIKRLPLKEGDVVKRGQVLAVVDQDKYKLALRQAQAAIDGARVALDATTREKQRFERLLKEDATAQAQYDQVRDKYRGAQAQMKQAQVALDMARKALEDTVIRAPYTGVVVKKVASVGDYATTMPPMIILVMMEIGTLELKVSLPEPELQRVAEGAPVQVRFQSMDRKVQAKISRIVRSVDTVTRSFQVIVEIPNEDMSLKPGLYARVRIAASKPRRRVLVPSEAIVDEGSDVYSVFVLENGVAKRREIRSTTADSNRTEVLTGLKGGEIVILDPAGLLDGDPVKHRSHTGKTKQRGPSEPRAAAEAAR